MERNHFNNFGRGSPKERICIITLKTVNWPRWRCGLKFSGDHLNQRSGTILAFFVEGVAYPANIILNY